MLIVCIVFLVIIQWLDNHNKAMSGEIYFTGLVSVS